MTTLPNFFVIGAAKSGTTSLYTYLREHPQVFMSPVKEPNFFSWGMSGETPPPGFRGTVIRDLGSYRDLFKDVTDETAIGEASPSYMRELETADRIRRRVPEAKLIAILRDPIERAYSGFLMFRRNGREPISRFDEAIEAEQRRQLTDRGYLERSRYVPQLRPYIEHFPSEQLQVHLYDDLRADAPGVVREICSFLGVDTDFRPDTSRRHNPAGSFRSLPMQRFMDDLPGPILSTAERIAPRRVRQRVYWTLRAWNTRPQPQLSVGTRERLLPLVRDDVLELQDLIDRDLSSWLVSDASSPRQPEAGR